MKTSRTVVPRLVALAVGAARTAIAIPVGYLAVLSGAALAATLVRRVRPAGPIRPPSDRTYAVLVPAHDEEAVIAETVAALTALDFPPDQVLVQVQADHCGDATVTLAREAGADVHERTDGPPGKGSTLAEAVARLLAEGHGGRSIDAFVVVDADTVVDRSFLRVVDRALEDGAQVVQGQYRVRDPDSSPAAGLRAVALALRHHVRPLGRTALGASCGLYGNGMVFTRAALDGRPWSNHLTEDVELQMELLLDGVLVAYAPDAVVEAEMPATLEAATTQNERWERGRIDLARRYVPQLLARVGRTRGRTRRAALDGALDHAVPPFSVLVLATAGVSVASVAVALLRRRRPPALAVLLPVALAGHVATGLALGGLPPTTVRSLAHAPGMVLWKGRLWLRMLTRGDDVRWVRTEHVGTAG